MADASGQPVDTANAVRPRRGLRGDAVVAGVAQYAPERHYRGERRSTLEQWATWSRWPWPTRA